jgi:PAS domain S-box-containing protein
MTSKKLTVLILEDSAADAELIESALRGANLNFTAVQVDGEPEFYRVLLEFAPDLIFADHALVASHERSALSASRHLHPAVPFIFISDTPGEEAAVEAVKRGATDYVLKERITRLGTVAHRALREKPWTAALTGIRMASGEERRDQSFQELGRLLRAIREIKRLVTRDRDPETLLRGAGNLLLRIRGYRHVGFGLVNSRCWQVRPVNCSEQKADYLNRFNVSWSGKADDPVPAGEVIHTGQPWICRDVATDPAFAPWRDEALANNCAALAAIPLFHDGQMFGVMTVCSDRPGSFPSEEVRLLEELANDLTFALIGLRRNQAFRNALEHLHLLSSALESAANAIAITDREGTALWVNPAFTWLTGFSPDEMRATRTNLFKYGGQDQAFSQPMWKTILAGGVWRAEQMKRRKDGHLYTEECTITPVRHDGEIAYFIAVKQDITERKQAEETLRWRTAFFEALVDSSHDGILVVDSSGNKILQNRRMIELWKIPPHIAENANDTEQVRFVTARTKDPEQFAKKVAALYANTDAVSHDEIELVDGMILDRYSSPVRDQNGRYYGRIWLFRDITERRQLEAQFRQAQKMEAVGQLAGGVAHDFNNILTAVIMHLGILQTTLTDPETASALKELESQAQRAADLTRQLLMFSRKSTIEVRPIALNHVVEEMLKMLGRLLGEHVSVEFTGTPELPLVEADRGMMQQVVMNLSVNGRDAMAEGGQLTIATSLMEFTEVPNDQPERQIGRFVRLSVKDTGCGMDDATRKRIFEPFFTTKALGKGTGLGLATVYGIVQQHRGWVEVTSAPGGGSTFDVYLPTTDKAGSLHPTETTLVMRRGQQETILLVEDELMVRLVTARGLQMLGYRVLEATDGQMAMELWAQHAGTIRLLLTDMIMPRGLSGLELAEHFQKENPALKVIIASGYSTEISTRGIPTKPGLLYLPKPFEMLNLASAIRTCLDQK